MSRDRMWTLLEAWARLVDAALARLRSLLPPLSLRRRCILRGPGGGAPDPKLDAFRDLCSTCAAQAIGNSAAVIAAKRALERDGYELYVRGVGVMLAWNPPASRVSTHITPEDRKAAGEMGIRLE